MKLSLDENRESTGGEQFVLNYTASSTWDQIKYMSWTTAEIVGLLDDYYETKQQEPKLKLSGEDLYNILEDNKRKFVKIAFFGYFENGIVKEIDYQITEFGLLDEDQIKIDIEQTEDWNDYMNLEEGVIMDDGYYLVDAIFRVETDGDDFRDWSWGELEYAVINWAHSKEEMENQEKDNIDIFFGDL